MIKGILSKIFFKKNHEDGQVYKILDYLRLFNQLFQIIINKKNRGQILYTDEVPRSSARRTINDDQRMMLLFLSKHSKASSVIVFVTKRYA